jgi:hypothetical protein
VTDDESDMEQENRIEDPESPEQRDVSAEENFHSIIRPTLKSKRHAG